MIFVDYLDRAETTATMPTVCMHCVEPTCALVCPADAIKVSEEGVVMSALKPRCLDCRNCVNACPFGVPKYNTAMHLQMKCDMCYDRSSEGLKPMCASVCPTGAISFGKYEQIVPLRPQGSSAVSAPAGRRKLLYAADRADPVNLGCGVFEGQLSLAGEQQPATVESWIDTQVEGSDKSNEF